ncbi:MAG: hypothetical protein AAB255_04205 [Bacteroidota bacterium]
MSTIYNRVKELVLSWVFIRSFDRFINILFSPYRAFKKRHAIRSAEQAYRQPRSRNQAVFICDKLNGRPIKIGFALKGMGWNVILLHRNNLSFDLSESFDETKKFENEFDALQIASEYTPVVYHIFSNYNFEVAYTFIKYKPGKVVFDNYDLLTGMVKEVISNRYKQQIALEQYCYLNANGLCCRDLRVQYLKENLPPKILFSEYCWPKEKFKKHAKLTDGIHVVYVGSIEFDPKSVEAFQYDLGAILSAQQVHLHIYPSHQHIVEEMQQNMKAFVTQELIDKYVHIHNVVSPLELISEISRYQYGLIISTTQVDFVDEGITYFHHMGDGLLPSKLFDYMEAGLFTLTQNARFIRFVLERYGNGKVVTSLEDIAEQCKHTPQTKINLPESLTLKYNSKRLVDFYLDLK